VKKVDFERQLSVSMEDGGIRVIPLVSESVRVLAIDYRILSDRRVLTFSLHGVWKCLRTPQSFGAWSKGVVERMTEGVEFWPSADGSDVYVDVNLGRVVVAGLKAKHLSRISAALDAAAARAEADRTGSFAEMAPDVSDLFAGDPQPIGFAGLLNVEERDFGGLAVGVVNARELYILLSSKRFFETWIEAHIRRLNLRLNVDYLKNNFKDANHSRVVRQYFLTEHAARGICLIDDSPASEAVRSYLGIVPAAADDAKKSRSKGSKRNAKQCVDVASTGEQPELPEMALTAEQPELPEMTSPGVDASQSVGGSAVGNAGTCLSVVTGAASPTIVGLPIYSFEFRGRLVRVVLKGASPWFVGVDVCLAIGIARLNTAVRPLPLAYMCVETIRGSRGIQRFMLLSEAGVLEIASRSVKPAAQAFGHWVRSHRLSRGPRLSRQMRQQTRLLCRLIPMMVVMRMACWLTPKTEGMGLLISRCLRRHRMRLLSVGRVLSRLPGVLPVFFLIRSATLEAR
jgi:phage anti-repressor protein